MASKDIEAGESADLIEPGKIEEAFRKYRKSRHAHLSGQSESGQSGPHAES